MNKSAILSAAIEILQDYGLGDLTMRRLATALSVAPGALYWHVPNKQALLGEVASHVLADIPDDLGSAARLCQHLWAAVVSVRDGAEIVVAAQAAGTVQRDVVGLLARCEGLDRPGAQVLVHYVLGAAWDLQTRQAVQRSLRVDHGGEADSEAAEAAVLAGVEAILAGLNS